MTYTPSLVILGHYFKKHMGMVNGFVASGSSVFTFVMPHILEAILSTFGVIESNFFTALLDESEKIFTAFPHIVSAETILF